MKKPIPFDKLSKKRQRELNAQKRITWGELNPITRRPENSRAYNRAKAQSWKTNTTEPLFFSQQSFLRPLTKPTNTKSLRTKKIRKDFLLAATYS